MVSEHRYPQTRSGVVGNSERFASSDILVETSMKIKEDQVTDAYGLTDLTLGVICHVICQWLCKEAVNKFHIRGSLCYSWSRELDMINHVIISFCP
jgi:hypothetical protein